MDMTIDQQVALDKALVPHARRLRIRRSNFHLLSNISSKESTFQLVEHKDTKKSNETYYPRFTKVIIHHFMSKDLLIPRRNKVNWYYVRDDHMFTMIKLAVVTEATPPKTKASIRKTKSSSDTTITPPLIVVVGTRLFTSAKGKQLATTSKAKSGSSADEGTGTILRVPDIPTKESDEEISWKSSDEGDDDDDEEEGDDGDDDKEGNDDDDQKKGSHDEQASDEECE
nr:hypothetical protein [Tanacetum cinerariifolium]